MWLQISEDVTIPGEQERRQTGCRPVTTRDPGISGGKIHFIPTSEGYEQCSGTHQGQTCCRAYKSMTCIFGSLWKNQRKSCQEIH